MVRSPQPEACKNGTLSYIWTKMGWSSGGWKMLGGNSFEETVILAGTYEEAAKVTSSS